jgi:hypothetical protein
MTETKATTENQPVTAPKYAALQYTMMRLGIFVACFAVLAVLSAIGAVPAGIGDSNALWIFALALVISAPISFVVLRRQRDRMSERIVVGMDRAKRKLHANRTMEDAD